jgi:hypothetical protein
VCHGCGDSGLTRLQAACRVGTMKLPQRLTNWTKKYPWLSATTSQVVGGIVVFVVIAIYAQGWNAIKSFAMRVFECVTATVTAPFWAAPALLLVGAVGALGIQCMRRRRQDQKSRVSREESVAADSRAHEDQLAELNRMKLKADWLDAAPTRWAPEPKTRFTWEMAGDNGHFQHLGAPTELPYMISFNIEPQTESELWRAGMIFYGSRLLDAQLLVHWGRGNDGQGHHQYVGYPINKGVNLKDAKYCRTYDTQRSCNLTVLVNEEHVFVKFDNQAYVYGQDRLGLAPGDLRNAYLIAFCDREMCHVLFTDIVARPATRWDESYLKDLVESTISREDLAESVTVKDEQLGHSIRLPKVAMDALPLIREALAKALRGTGGDYVRPVDILHELKVGGKPSVDGATLDIALMYLVDAGEVDRHDGGHMGEPPNYRLVHDRGK